MVAPDHQTLLRRAPYESLNLYLPDATDDEVNEVMNDYGNTIKQLAAANIFPGDMLLKNFGVTRHGRVVFYDYDEIEPLVDCRQTHPATARRNGRAIGPCGIRWGKRYLPRGVPPVFSGNARARATFDAQHADLYDADLDPGSESNP